MAKLASRNNDIANALKIVRELSADDKMRELAEAREKQARDERGRISFARDEGRLEGRMEGIAVGEKRGRSEGRTEGLAEGMSKANLDAAQRMKADGVEPAFIIRYIGISKEELDAL